MASCSVVQTCLICINRPMTYKKGKAAYGYMEMDSHNPDLPDFGCSFNALVLSVIPYPYHY